MDAYLYKLLPPRPDFPITRSDAERATMTEQDHGFRTEVTPFRSLVTATGRYGAPA